MINITIPKSVTEIGMCAFADCDELSDVTCLSETAPDIDISFSRKTKKIERLLQKHLAKH